MIIILEGPRGTGKTSLSTALASALVEIGYRPQIMKFERGDDPTADMLKTLSRLHRDSLSADGDREAFIIDRFHLTEFVMRMDDRLVPSNKLMLDLISLSYMIEKIGAWVFVLSAPEEIRFKRVADRKDGRGDESIIVMRTWEYLTRMFNGPTGRGNIFGNVFLLDTSGYSPDAVARFALARIKGRLSDSYVHP